jgi:hypothetical protein
VGRTRREGRQDSAALLQLFPIAFEQLASWFFNTLLSESLLLLPWFSVIEKPDGQRAASLLGVKTAI